MQLCCDLLSNLQKSHSLSSMACDKDDLTRVSAIELIPPLGISPNKLGRNTGRVKMSAQYLCMFRFKAAPWTSAKLFNGWK